VVVNDIENDFDAGFVKRLHHRLEFWEHGIDQVMRIDWVDDIFLRLK